MADKPQFMLKEDCMRTCRLTNGLIMLLLTFMTVAVVLVGFDIRNVAQARADTQTVKEQQAGTNAALQTHEASDAIRNKFLVEAVNELKTAVKEIHQDIKRYQTSQPPPGGS